MQGVSCLLDCWLLMAAETYHQHPAGLAQLSAAATALVSVGCGSPLLQGTRATSTVGMPCSKGSCRRQSRGSVPEESQVAWAGTLLQGRWRGEGGPGDMGKHRCLHGKCSKALAEDRQGIAFLRWSGCPGWMFGVSCLVSWSTTARQALSRRAHPGFADRCHLGAAAAQCKWPQRGPGSIAAAMPTMGPQRYLAGQSALCCGSSCRRSALLCTPFQRTCQAQSKVGLWDARWKCCHAHHLQRELGKQPPGGLSTGSFTSRSPPGRQVGAAKCSYSLESTHHLQLQPGDHPPGALAAGGFTPNSLSRAPGKGSGIAGSGLGSRAQIVAAPRGAFTQWTTLNRGAA